jgi:hypothetical protein
VHRTARIPVEPSKHFAVLRAPWTASHGISRGFNPLNAHQTTGSGPLETVAVFVFGREPLYGRGVRSIVIVALLGASFGCGSDGDGTCGSDYVCTEILTSVGVEVVDEFGQPVPSMVTRTEYVPTGSVMHESSGEHLSGWYTVLDDLVDKSQLLPGERHEVRFFARGERGTAMGDFVLRAGQCVCHVEKIDGPEQLVLQPL